MADRSVAIKLTANVQGLVAGLKTGQKAMQDFGAKGLDAIGKNEQSINTLSNTAGVLGVAMVGAATLAVKAFADFDSAMSSVQASTMESAANMDLLRDAALDAGARTAFSATEAAGAIEELAKAGVSTADILGGGLDGALDLAAAGGIEVADAAEIAASALTQFGLKGEDVTHVADLLAAGAGKAQGGVSDLGAALNQSGLVASQMGLSVEEAVGSLTAFASAGLTGSDAGTSFRSMLLRLANPTKESAELMAELGINAYDAGGNFVGMEALAGQLESRLGSLTQEQRNAALAQIFGQDAIRTSAILYEQGAEGVREWTAAVDEQGYAAEVAATRLDNLAGDLEALQGSFETLMIGLGEGANGPLRSLVQSVTDAVNTFAELPPVVQGATMAIVGGGGLVLLGVAGLGKLAIGANDTITALKEMGVISQATGTKVTGMATGLAKVAGVAVGVAAAAAATGMLVDHLKGGVATPGAEKLARAIRDIADNGGAIGDLGGQFANFGDVLGLSVNKAESMGDAFDQMLKPSVTDRISSFFGSIPGVTSYMENLEARASDVDATLSGMVTAGEIEAVQAFQRSLQEAGYTTEEINRLLPQTEDALIGAEEAAKAAADGQDDFGSATQTATGAIDAQVESLAEMIDKQKDAGGVVSSQMEAQAALEAAIDGASAAIEENGATLDLNTEKGRANQTALLDIKDAGYELITSMEANGATQEQLQGTMATTRQRFLDAATAMGMGAAEAEALADELGLIPSSVYVNVDVEADTGVAQWSIDQLIARNDGKRINLRVEATGSGASYVGATYRTATGAILRATGGLVTGPGTSTSDSIPAYLSNGEYVVKTAAVNKYGPAFFDQVNAMRFSGGGLVGASAVPAGSGALGGADLVDALQQALTGVTWVVDGQPLRAIARTEVTGALRSYAGGRPR